VRVDRYAYFGRARLQQLGQRAPRSRLWRSWSGRSPTQWDEHTGRDEDGLEAREPGGLDQEPSGQILAAVAAKLPDLGWPLCPVVDQGAQLPGNGRGHRWAVLLSDYSLRQRDRGPSVRRPTHLGDASPSLRIHQPLTARGLQRDPLTVIGKPNRDRHWNDVRQLAQRSCRCLGGRP
jgi:hypothetical protein